MSNARTTAAGRPSADVFADILGEARRNWGWFIALGIALVITGIVTLGIATAATIVSVIFIGSIIIVEGVLQAAIAFRTRTWGQFGLYLAGAVLSLIVGVLLVFDPLAGALSLTLVLSAFFLVGGGRHVPNRRVRLDTFSRLGMDAAGRHCRFGFRPDDLGRVALLRDVGPGHAAGRLLDLPGLVVCRLRPSRTRASQGGRRIDGYTAHKAYDWEF